MCSNSSLEEVPEMKHIILYINKIDIFYWLSDLITSMKIENMILKPIYNTVPGWILLIETETSVIIENSIVSDIIEYIHEKLDYLQIILENNILRSISNKISIISIKSRYHHLLPGFLIVVRIKEVLDFNLIKPKKYTFFAECFKQLHHLHPPISSSQLHFQNIFFKKEENKELPNKQLKNELLHQKIILPSNAVTFIIGKKGKSIEHIRQQTNANIKIYEPIDPLINNNSQNKENEIIKNSQYLQVIAIDGYKDEIEDAQRLIQDKLRIWNNQQYFR